MNIIEPESVAMSSQRLARIGEHLRSRYVEPGKIPGSLTLVARAGEICYLQGEGMMDLERQKPMCDDAIFRIYSMTKPITTVALMMLHEKGLFSLTDSVQRYIPEWKKLRVYKGGSWPMMESVPATTTMTVRDLMMHTSGLTYGFLHASNVDHAYRKIQVQHIRPDYVLKDMIDELADLPLEFNPGEEWNYSVATDVLGYLIELLSGQSLAEFFQEHIFTPLGMLDTAFEIAPEKVDRFTACYQRGFSKELLLEDDPHNSAYQHRSFYSGGGGLIATISDYYRFCQMLLNGGELNGHRILGSRTVEFMTQNHLPGGVDMSEFARGSFSETTYDGIGFGLGFAQRVDAVKGGSMGSLGEYFWGGMASTIFWNDPVEDLNVIFMTQLIPSGTFNFRGQLQSIIYSALLDH